MDNEPEPFAKQLQDAVERGQVVLIPAPDRPPSQHPATQATPPQRDRDEKALAAVLCLLFGLRRSEGQVLMKMATQDYVAKKEIHAAAAQDERTIAESSVSVVISGMRKKLIVHNIEISTLRGFGYALRKESRDRICRRLAKYDAGLIPTTPRPRPGRARVKPEAPDPIPDACAS